MTTVDKIVSGTITWVDLQTPDLDKTRAFYRDLLGWSYQGGEDADTAFYTMARLGDRNVCGMAKLRPGSSFPPMWSIYFATESADDIARRVAEGGGKVVMPPMDVMEEGRMAYFTDPTGAYFGVWQARKHQGARVVDEPGAMAWHEVYTRDVGTARDFYARLFGLESKRAEGTEDEYWTLHRGDKVACGVMQMPASLPASVPAHWHTYFAVASVDEAVRVLGARGGVVFEAPFDTPYGRIAAVADPVGAVFNLLERPAAG